MTDHDLEIYRAQLDERRRVRRWTYRELAFQAGLDVATVHRALAGSRPLRLPTLKLLADVLGLDLKLVLRRDDD